MTFVVVYLIDIKRNVAVPETWVQDLNNAKLKNRGKNSNQNFLVFWSGTNGRANIENEPNFRALKAAQYFSTHDGVCYNCRVKKFFDNFDDASEYVNQQRPITPPVYNEARVNELPIPNVLQPFDAIEMDDLGGSDTGTDENAIDPLFVSNGSEINISTQSNTRFHGIAHSTAIQESISNESVEEREIQELDANENVDGLANVSNSNSNELQLEQNSELPGTEDFVRIENALDDPLLEVKEEPEIDLGVLDLEELRAIVQNASDEHDSFENIDDDLMIQKLDEYPRPKELGFEVKEGDSLCGNVPFRSYVTGARGFLVMTEPNSTELRLNNECIQVLLKWNDGHTRKKKSIDKLFIEYLFISFVGVQKIQSGDYNTKTIDLIKDLFKVRINGDNERLGQFEKVIDMKLNEVRGRATQPNKVLCREKDRVSDDMPFDLTLTCSRIYTVANKKVEIKKNIIDRFIVWTTNPYIKDKTIDERMVRELLEILREQVGFDPYEVPREILEFIRKFISVRVDGDEYRMNEVAKYIGNWQKDNQ